MLLPQKVWFPKKTISLESTSLCHLSEFYYSSQIDFCEAPFSLRYSYSRTQIFQDLITWLCTALSFGTYAPVLLFSTWYKLLCGWHALNISAAESKQKCQSMGVLKKLLRYKFFYSWNVWNSDVFLSPCKKCCCWALNKISNKFYQEALTIKIFWGDFCRRGIKTWKSWPKFFKFQSKSILVIHCNRQQETVSIPKI